MALTSKLKLAILKPIYNDEGELRGYRPLIESEDGDFEREIASRVRRILGPKGSHTGEEVDAAIAQAFENYKSDFKRKTIRLK